jgi:transcriptional regulator with XRE-family HTH domain
MATKTLENWTPVDAAKRGKGLLGTQKQDAERRFRDNTKAPTDGLDGIPTIADVAKVAVGPFRRPHAGRPPHTISDADAKWCAMEIARRLSSGESSAEIAADAGVSVSAIKNIEAGRQKPGSKVLAGLSGKPVIASVIVAPVNRPADLEALLELVMSLEDRLHNQTLTINRQADKLGATERLARELEGRIDAMPPERTAPVNVTALKNQLKVMVERIEAIEAKQDQAPVARPWWQFWNKKESK